MEYPSTSCKRAAPIMAYSKLVFMAAVSLIIVGPMCGGMHEAQAQTGLSTAINLSLIPVNVSIQVGASTTSVVVRALATVSLPIVSPANITVTNQLTGSNITFQTSASSTAFIVILPALLNPGRVVVTFGTSAI